MISTTQAVSDKDTWPCTSGQTIIIKASGINDDQKSMLIK